MSDSIGGLVARLRDYKGCTDGDIDRAADELELLDRELEKIKALPLSETLYAIQETLASQALVDFGKYSGEVSRVVRLARQALPELQAAINARSNK